MPDSFQSSLLNAFPSIQHGFTGRASGLEELQNHNYIISQQIHGVKIYAVEKPFTGRQEIDGYDGLVTRQKNITLVIQTADCAPILFFDPATKTLAAAHAGRAGTELGLAEIMVNYLKNQYTVQPENLLACIGPSICVNCYQIDRAKDIHYNLWTENQKQLLSAGLLSAHIELSGLCTACNAQARFYSYRREKTALRNFAFIQLKPV
jgi:copper oxidase (laccase) domain-containing protein